MYAIDFMYDNHYLSDYGFIVCDFDYSDGAVVADTGLKVTFTKVSRNNGKSNSLVNTKYEECVQATFDICKDPDLYDYDEREITDAEYRTLARWLNRREFLKFCFIEDNNSEPCYYNVSFNISKIKISEKLYGLRLTLESDKPFGYGEERSFSYNFSNNHLTETLTDVSDEIGYIYPFVEITCRANGDLSIHNSFDDCTTLIKNCSNGEVITFNGESLIIKTSYNSHSKIYKDFNYEFLKIGNTFNSRNNTITVSRPCKIDIRYAPIIKNVL